MAKIPDISVVIPVRNEAAKIRQCIEGLLNQTIPVREIIVVDSGSTDGTLDILSEYPIVKVISIPPEEFNHGETRNLGVRAASGDLVLLTVGDATFTDGHALGKMIKHFSDEIVAGVCGYQIVPHIKGYNPHLMFRPQNPPEIKSYHFPDNGDFRSLSADKRYKCCTWDDVCAMYRKSVIDILPFDHVTFAEDMMWAKKALESKYKIVYDNSVLIEHYHPPQMDIVYKRVFTVWYHIYKAFGYLRPNPYSFKHYLRVFYWNFRYKEHPKWIWINWRIFMNTSKAVKKIKRLINKGEVGLDNYHHELCGIPPKGN